MRFRRTVIETLVLVGIFLFFCGEREAGAQQWAVNFDGVGPIKVGMTLKHVNSLLQSNLHPSGDEEPNCFHVNPPKHPGLHIMLVNGTVGRVEVDLLPLRTERGIGFGSSEKAIKRIYGPLVEVTPHAYLEEEGHYLTISSQNGKRAMRFETSEGKVFLFYAGRTSAVSYIEGCL